MTFGLCGSVFDWGEYEEQKVPRQEKGEVLLVKIAVPVEGPVNEKFQRSGAVGRRKLRQQEAVSGLRVAKVADWRPLHEVIERMQRKGMHVRGVAVVEDAGEMRDSDLDPTRWRANAMELFEHRRQVWKMLQDVVTHD
jgi:hypothetical protein